MSLLDANGNPLISSAEKLRVIRRAKYNPLRTLGPVTLARALDNFDAGYLRDAALLFEVIAERDDTLKSVKPKREKEVSQLDWQVMPVAAKDSTYEEHKRVLEDFWNNVRAVNAYDRNEKGGFKRLVRQMMSSVSMRYAVHHIVWRPSAEGLRASFESVPLWLFENITGSLRYLRDPFAAEGETLNDDEWMVTPGDGLMISCSIGYHAKRSTFNDWLIFSEKFAMPGVLGRTSAAKGTPEGDMMREAVASFGHDWNGVLYGDDGQHKDPIQLIQANGNPAAMPMPAIIERVDRKFAALYRGADLSTMSSNDGEGTGASLQGEEKGILLRDDAEVITETLERISRRVIQWNFGWGVEPAARLEMIVPTDEDGQFLLDASCTLADRGAPVSLQSTMDRLSIQAADEGDEVLQPSSNAQTPASKEEETEEVANADEPYGTDGTDGTYEDAAREMLDGARAEDLRPLGDRLAAVMEIENPALMKEALKALDVKLPELLASDASAAAWEDIYASALVDGFAEGEDGRLEDSRLKIGNVAGGDHWRNQSKGADGRFGPNKGASREGKTKVHEDQFGKLPQKGEALLPKQNELRMWRSLSHVQTHHKQVDRAAFREEVGVIALPWGRPGTEEKNYEDGFGVSKIMVKHPNDVAMIPAVVSRGVFYEHDREPGKKAYAVLGDSHLMALGRKNKRSAWVITHFEDPKTIRQIKANQKKIQGG